MRMKNAFSISGRVAVAAVRARREPSRIDQPQAGEVVLDRVTRTPPTSPPSALRRAARLFRGSCVGCLGDYPGRQGANRDVGSLRGPPQYVERLGFAAVRLDHDDALGLL